MSVDSIATTVVVSVATRDSAGSLAVNGSIDSLYVRRGIRIMAPDSTPPLPIILHGMLTQEGRVLALGRPGAVADSACETSGLDPLIMMTRDVFVRLPSRVASGMSWTDTTRMTSCRGRIPITTTTVATYTVLGQQNAEGEGMLALGRSAVLTLEGSGMQFGRSAAVQGSGSAHGTLLIDPDNAEVVEGRSESTMVITFEAGMLRQTFTQRARLEIRRR